MWGLTFKRVRHTQYRTNIYFKRKNPGFLQEGEDIEHVGFDSRSESDNQMSVTVLSWPLGESTCHPLDLSHLSIWQTVHRKHFQVGGNNRIGQIFSLPNHTELSLLACPCGSTEGP